MPKHNFVKKCDGENGKTAEALPRGTKHAVFLAVAAAVLIPALSSADTLLWYRFDGDGTTIENKANPGVMDGTLKSIEHWGWAGSQPFGDVESKFPVRAAEFVQGARVIDPKTNTLYARANAMSWTGDKDNTGAVYVPAANLTDDFKGMTSFTYEAFFKVSQDAIDRATGGGDAMFPIVHWGNDTGTAATGEGLMLAIYYTGGKLYPFCRFYYNQSDSRTLTANWINDSITLDVWHHVALVVDGSAGTVTFYIDWNNVGSSPTSLSDFQGIRYDSSNNRVLSVGANPYKTGRSFLGEMAEVRISNVALTTDEFLRPVPPGPVDDDTLVYLPLGDTRWFANTVPLSNGKWNAPLNGAPTAAWNPKGWSTTQASANLPYGVPAVADEAHGSAVRGGCLDINALADVKSYTFSSATVSGYNMGHIIEFPKDGLSELYAGDFTFEWFFKTSYQSNQAMLVNPWTKVMINGGKIHPRVGDFNGGSGTGSAVVNDGLWHHCALVYRHGVNAFECWVDYRLDNSRSADDLASNSQGFYFGGQGYSSQVFNGQLDDLRITKRALAPHEFLTTIPVADNASATDILHATLEDTLSSGQDELFVSNAVVRVAGTDAEATPYFVTANRDYDLDNDGKVDTTSAKALALDGSNYLDFPGSPVFQSRDFTLEFFAKVSGLGSSAQFVRIARCGYYANVSTLALSQTGGISANVSATGAPASVSSKSIAAPSDFGLADGKWHHWAVAASANYANATTTVRIYRDYEEVPDCGGTVEGVCAFSANASYSLLFGYSGSANGGLTGQLDEIRLRPGVQPVSSFMRWVPKKGLMLIIR